MNYLKAKMLEMFMGVIVTKLTAENAKKVMDFALDLVEDQVEKTETTADDAFVLPVCKQIRDAFDIPDND